MPLLPAVLHAIALLLALNVQYLQSPLAGSWLAFHLAGCACLLGSNKEYPHKNIVWYSLLTWLVTVVAATFILRPVSNGALTMWFLTAMPMLALCMKKEHLKSYTIMFGAMVLLYALGLILQMTLNVKYTLLNYDGFFKHNAMAWPLIDPNNASAVLNTGLLPSFYLSLHKDRRWAFVTLIFTLALLTTVSKAGMLVAVLGCIAIAAHRLHMKASDVASILGVLTVFSFILPDELWAALSKSMNARLPLWEGSYPLAFINPLTGIGLGKFDAYYATSRIEHDTAGLYAHNDILQFAIEMGIPAALIFCVLCTVIALRTRRSNFIGACVFFALLAQASFEFQFYLPVINLLGGLALAHYLWSTKKLDNIPQGIYHKQDD